MTVKGTVIATPKGLIFKWHHLVVRLHPKLLALPFPGCVNLDKLLLFSDISSLYYKMEIIHFVALL